MNRRVPFDLDRALRRSPLQKLFRWRASRRLVVLAYHEVADAEGLSEQVEFLSREMSPVSLSDVVSAIRGGKPLPPRAVLLTFDDGHPSVFEQGLPILEDVGIPAVIFVVPGLVETHRPLWWVEAEEYVRRGAIVSGLPPDDPHGTVRAMKEMSNADRLECVTRLRRSAGSPPLRVRQLTKKEILELAAGGVAIGNHTWTHPCLDRCSDEVVDHEIVRAHEALTETLGKPPVAFAYPNGNYDPRARPILARLGYEIAFLFDHRIGPFPPRDPYRVSRIRVSSTTEPDRFRILVSGLHSSIHHLRGRP